jgi:tRNA (pseudouridine54-N1)-methyltransferase
LPCRPAPRPPIAQSCSREQAFGPNPCFILTDHIPMPPKTLLGLERLGAKKLSLGPRMLFASQCVVLIHHELDLR